MTDEEVDAHAGDTHLPPYLLDHRQRYVDANDLGSGL